MAAEKGHAAVVQLLLDKGADFTIRDTEVLAILFIGCIHTYILFFRIFLIYVVIYGMYVCMYVCMWY
jgi:hypothetical protein